MIKNSILFYSILITQNDILIKIKCSIYSVRSVMHKYLEKKEEVNFDKIFNQVLGNSINILLFIIYLLPINTDYQNIFHTNLNKLILMVFVFLGYLLFKDFCEHLPEDEQIPEIKFYDEVTFIIN